MSAATPPEAFRQTKLPLEIPEHITLVGLVTARAVLGRPSEYVLDKVAEGNLRWVFDLRAGSPAQDEGKRHGGQKRELRFWVRELQQPVNCNLHLTEVIAAILGQGATITRGNLEQNWVVSHPTIGRWVSSKELVLLDRGRITRASLETFLASRWTGASRPAPQASRLS